MLVQLGKTCRPMPCGEGQSVFNVATCDPESLMSLLSLHLGLPTPKGDRTIELNAVLTEHARPEDFFYRSCTIDPIGVSRVLLALIDEIALGAGMDFEWQHLTGSSRLDQLVRIAIEMDNRPAITSMATMLRRVISALKDPNTRNPVSHLILVEPRTGWPRLWHELFAALEAGGTEIFEREKIEIMSGGDTDLGRVARRLLTDRSALRFEAALDQTMMRIHGASVAEVADAISALVRSELQMGRSITIIRSSEPQALDAAFARQNLPVLGCARIDRGCGPVEILPLMLDLASGPADPATYLALLSMDPNPLPAGLRRRLIRELHDKSAVDSTHAYSIVDQYYEKFPDSKISEHVSIWKEWIRKFGNRKETGVTSLDIEPTLRFVESWANASLTFPDSDDHAFGILLSNVRRLREYLAAATKTAWSRIQLQSLMAQIFTPAQHMTSREQSSLFAVEDAAAVPARSDCIIWWMAHDSILPSAKRSIWTDSERAVLENGGVELQNAASSCEESYASAIRLLSLATQRFVLVTVDRIGDDPVAVHPLWREIEDSFVEGKRPPSLSVQAVWSWLANEGPSEMDSIDVPPQAPFVSTWEIPTATHALRERESPSSLEKMLGRPLAWTLQYRAGLYDGSSYGLADGFLLLGILAHACFEEFFKSGAWTSPQDQAATQATQIFHKCLAMRAGILLTPGRDRERLDAEHKIIAGLLDLAAVLKAGSWEFVSAEEMVETTDLAQPVQGRPDLVFRRIKTPNEKLIIDVKYVGKRRRLQELMRGAAIQLATYSRILRSGQSWPKTAYYIVSTQEVLTVHADLAPNLYRVNAEDEADIWSRVEASINMTTARLAQGFVDVGINNDNPEVLAEAGRITPAPCSYCEYQLFCSTHRRSA